MVAVRVVAAQLRAAAPGRLGLALRAALCVGAPLAVGLATGAPEQGAAASFGGLAGLSVPQAPYRYRARVVGAVGAGLVAAVLLGGWASADGILVVLVTGLVVGTASFVCQAAELPPPRELMLIMTVLAAADLVDDPSQVLPRAGLAAAGAAGAWLVTMAPAVLGRRRDPERRAVTDGFDAVAGLLEAIGSDAADPARQAAIVAVRRARTAVRQAGLPAAVPLARAAVALESVLEAALHVDVEASEPLPREWGAAVRSLAPGRDAARPPEPGSVIGAAQLHRAILDARDASPAGPELRAWPGIGPQLRAAARRGSVVLPAAARIGVAVAIAMGLGRVLGLGHAYWMGLTVAAVLQGSNLAATRSRVTQRVVGTALGVALGFAVLGWGPPLWVAVLVVALCQCLVELVISTHYGLAVVGITVLALLLFHIGAPDEDIGAAIGARLLDTALGAALALALRRVLWPRATSTRLPRVQAETVDAARRTLTAAWTGSAALVPERRRLQGELAVLHAVHADALADAGSGPSTPGHQWPVSVAVEELAVLALSWPRHRTPPDAAHAEPFLRHLDDVAAALVDGHRPGPAPTLLPGHPRTLAAATALITAVRRAGSG
ncbi:MAG TPA: FUSC family protein [Pseudonocardia sp.]|nr:FUSC family protein [Pseudonocardia sp.]